MSESQVIAQTQIPVTMASLTTGFLSLGVRKGMTVLLHSSLSQLGWVCGGAQAVVTALLDIVTPDGTLVVPTHSAGFTDPSQWGAPPVPEDWWPLIRETMPAFDPALTPTRKMGAIADVVRGHPSARRSNHPQVSFAAVGAESDYITRDHELAFGLGERSPLGRIYDLDGQILLLGVGFDRNTSLHLAEHRASYPAKRNTRQGAPVVLDRQRVWTEFEDIALDTDDANQLGDDFDATGRVQICQIGNAIARLMSQRAFVDFTTRWYEQHRR